ncbi:MAG: UbiA family prenyltransferase [Bacteroidetes bacterium]|nr:UbiA family prenyltransferase [Bacteroidota bacterium]
MHFSGLHAFTRFIVYSNLFIGGCATALAAETFYLLQLPPSLNWYLLLLFCCTIFVYSLHYYVKAKKDKQDSRLDWCRQHPYLLLYTIIGSALLVAGGVLFHFDAIFLINGRLNVHNLTWFIVIPLLALAYSHPLFPGHTKSLRHIGWLKMISLSFIWSFTTTLLPVWMLATRDTPPLYPMLVVFLHRFFFIASLSVLFNINDYEEDKADGVRTIAVAWGPESTLQKGKWLSLVLGMLTTAWLLYTFQLISPLFLLATGIPLLLLFGAWHYFRKSEEEAFFVLRYDGLMIVKALLLIFALLIQHK